MSPSTTTSVNLISVFAIFVVAVVTLLRQWKTPLLTKIFQSTAWTRVVSMGIGGLLGIIYWLSASNAQWNFICQFVNIPIVAMKFSVALVQGLIAGVLGTAGVAFVHTLVDRNNPSNPPTPPVPPSV